MSEENNPLGEKEKEAQDLKRKVLKCLQQSGFPFEARVARAFANLEMDDEYKDLYVTDFGNRPIDNIGCLNRGVPVQCGSPFQDPVTKKSRELDVHSIVPLDSNGTALWIHFLVQCKDTNKIWTFGHYGFEAIPTIDGKYVPIGLEPKTKKDFVFLKAFTPDPVICIGPEKLCGIAEVLKTVKDEDEEDKQKKSTKVKPDNEDEIFEATITAVNSVRYYVKTTEELLKIGPELNERKLLIFIPMVATGNKLFFSDLSQDNPAIQEVDAAFYLHQSLEEDGLTRNHYVVPIVTESSLPRVVNSFTKTSLMFLKRYFV